MNEYLHRCLKSVMSVEDKMQIEYVTENGEKNLRRFPGVLIGRLGTNSKLSGLGYGTAVMDFIKAWFRSEENKIKQVVGS